jgi:hypothetical protein
MRPLQASSPSLATDASRCGRQGFSPCAYLRFFFPYTGFIFSGRESSKRIVVQCKGCRENIPAPVESVPAQPIAARCPICGDHRRYLPSEVFLGRLSHLLMIRNPVRTADGRTT